MRTPVIVKRNMRQTATYWEPSEDIDPRSGGRILENPINTLCKWEESAQLYKDDSGSEFFIEARIYLPFIPETGAYIARGRDADQRDAKQITSIDRALNLSGTAEVVSAIIARQ